MSYRSAALAICLSLGCVALAVACTARARHLDSKGAWLLHRGSAEAAEYLSTFDGKYVDQELVTYEERRAVLERAHLWRRGATSLVMAAALLAFASYVLFLLVRLQAMQLGTPASHSPLQVR